MTRQKRIEKEKQIEAFIYLFIAQAEVFDYWLDRYLFQQIAYSCQCSPHLVRRIFFKKLYPNEKFYKWLSEFEY